MADIIHRIPLWRTDQATTIPRAGNDDFVTETDEPELHVFPAATARNTGIAAVICPGGGYGGLAIGPEGHACAAWLAHTGVTGLVLRYRLPHGDVTIPLADAQQALSYARGHAGAWGFSPEKLGVLGFSAGGHLAALAATARETTRPAFSALFYPVIDLAEGGKGVTRTNLLGDAPEPHDIREYSCQARVDAATPPALLLLCDDDPLVPPRHSLAYYEALQRHGVAASMHIFPRGGHAWGFRDVNMAGEPFRHGDVARSVLLDWLLQTAGHTC